MQRTTALYDAVIACAEHLKNNTRVERKIMLVMTDGQDNASRGTLQEAAPRLQQENGPTLYAIGLLEEVPRQSGREALETLAEGTGGAAWSPASLDDPGEISQTMARDIRSQHTIGYKPGGPQPNAG